MNSVPIDLENDIKSMAGYLLSATVPCQWKGLIPVLFAVNLPFDLH